MRFLPLCALLLCCGGDPSPQMLVFTPTCDQVAMETWESAPWPPETDTGTCAWIEFPAKATVEVQHALGRTPLGIQLFLSFRADGTSSAPSAGDTTRILDVNEAAVTVANGTNEDFYLKVVLR